MCGIATAVVGVGLVSGYMSSRAQSKAASQATSSASAATMYGIDAQMNMFDRSMKQFKPFYDAGVNALTDMQEAPTGAEPPQLPSPDIKFEFNPDDETYKLQKEEITKSINQQLAARGAYDSRPGINALSDAYRKLQATATQEQYGRAVDQYGREYTSGVDKFNIENALAKQNYGKYQDIVKLGAGAASSMGQSASQTGQGVASSYNAMANTLWQGNMAQGNAQAGMWQDIGAAPMNAIAGYYYGKKAGVWGK